MLLPGDSAKHHDAMLFGLLAAAHCPQFTTIHIVRSPAGRWGCSMYMCASGTGVLCYFYCSLISTFVRLTYSDDARHKERPVVSVSGTAEGEQGCSL